MTTSLLREEERSLGGLSKPKSLGDKYWGSKNRGGESKPLKSSRGGGKALTPEKSEPDAKRRKNLQEKNTGVDNENRLADRQLNRKKPTY